NTLLKNINKSHNWKAPGQDRIHNFCLKKLTTTHKYLLAHFNNFIQQPDTFPDYLSQGVTFLKPKDTDTKNPAKYRPITCLSTTYKLLTSCLTDMIYQHCNNFNILGEEQKGCTRSSFGCKE